MRVSVVIPIYNEERYLADCVDSLLKQTYPLGDMEWLFVDGGSTDRTREILTDYQKRYPQLIYLYDNPQKTAPYAMNIGIGAARGAIIIRMDAHAEYESNYIERCVHYLDTTDADDVGGFADTRGRGFMGKCIAAMLASRFGVGNSEFRVNGKSGYVDTVPFGAFRREVFERWGGYDVRLTRNQDNEMSYRIRKNGGKIYLAEDIRFTYYCRDSVRGIVDMARQNGMWNVITMRLCPGSMGVRHFIPLAFLLSIVGLLLLGILWRPFWALLLAELLLYLTLDLIFSLKQAQGIKGTLFLLFLFPAFHLTYGFGSVMGILKLFTRKFSPKTA